MIQFFFVSHKLWSPEWLIYKILRLHILSRLNDSNVYIYLCLGIVNHDFSRIELKEGEIKKEFDDMQMSIYKEQREKELHSLELAKKLQVI